MYADWLLERGDPRGHFINAQCAVAACERAGERTSDRYRAARVRAHLLQRDLGARLLAGLRADSVTRIERGFVTRARLEVDALEPLLPRLARTPLEMLHLREGLRYGALRRALPQLPRSLALLGFDLGFGLAATSGSLDVPGLREALATVPAHDDDEVWPGDGRLPAPPLDALVRGLHVERPHLFTAAVPRGVRSLGLLPPRDVAALRSFLAALADTEVEALTVYCSDETVCAAIESAPIAQLRELELGYELEVGPEAARAFVARGGGARLERFAAPFPVDADVAAVLARSRLVHLGLGNGGDLEAAGAVLARHPLHTIELAGFTPPDALRLLDAVPATVSDLYWRAGELDDDHVRALSERTTLARLSLLSLSEVAMGSAATAALLAAEPLAGVPWLRLTPAPDGDREPDWSSLNPPPT
ncbi:MAG: hypothetical protein KIT84_41440 [Labilithrix sp.]|nr:hypothetical protein [Labilithrix sp.]MCW5817536.1 hypothetical protein [Labilithrix sp.]